MDIGIIFPYLETYGWAQIFALDYSRKYLEDVYQINIEDIVYPGVDVDRFDKDKTKKEDNVILLVSRLYKEKNIDIGIKVLSLLDDSYVLKIVGKGPYKGELQKLSEKLNVSDRIVFYDFVDDKKTYITI